MQSAPAIGVNALSMSDSISKDSGPSGRTRKSVNSINPRNNRMTRPVTVPARMPSSANCGSASSEVREDRKA